VIAVYVALAMVVFVGLAAVVVDLGVAYANRRQMQNAADAAALAATQQLQKAIFGATVDLAAAGQVDGVARTTVADNGGDLDAKFRCRVIRPDDSEIADCTATSTWAATGAGAVGVRVTAGHQVSTFFAGIFGSDSTTASTVAAARVQRVAQASGPFLVCSSAQYDDGHGHAGSPLPDLMVKVDGQWQVNTAAIGQVYLLHGPQVSTCGATDDDFKGLADDPQDPYALPAYVQTDTGNHAGPVRVQVAGSTCTDVDTIGCAFLTPVCVDDPAPTGAGHNLKLYCVAWGAFEIDQAAANKHTGKFLGTVNVIGPGGGTPTPGDPTVVSLVQ
jgi:Flp pilus assembly protein TadG